MENPFSKKPTPEAGGGIAPAVANGSSGNQTGATPVPVSAVESVPKYGGNRGGKPRRDGLVPGSPQAKEADRKKETDRKALYRANLAAQNPAVIPAVLPEAGSVSDQGKAQAGSESAGAVSSFVAWDEKTVRPALEEIIPIWEQERKKKRLKKAIAAKLPAPLIKAIEQEGWDQKAKAGVIVGGGQVIAKWLNKFGLSAEYAPEVTLATGLVALYRSDSRLDAKLDEIIAQNARREAGEPKP